MIRFAKLLYLGLCIEALFSIAYRGTFLLTHSFSLAWAAAVAVLLFAGVCYAAREAVLGRAFRLFTAWRAESKLWFACWLILGLLLRIAWVHAFGISLKSDGMAYYSAATQLAAHTYSGVYWPPGLPVVLASLMMLFGPSPYATVVTALLLFAGTCSMAWLLARELGGRVAAGIAVALLAVWPGYLTTVGINSKENLIAFLLTGTILLYCKAIRKNSWLMLACAGILAGWAALTQPGCLLFAGVIFCVERMRGTRLRMSIWRSAIFALATLAAILPWTYRNHQITHRFVLITVNGGSVFYRANNPKANASYSPEGEIVLPTDMYQADKVGYREGKKWIAQHPVSFLVLAVRKQVGYLGDDAIGVYETMERDKKPPVLLYAGAKAVCSAFWLALWCFLLMGRSRLFQGTTRWKWYGLCFLPVVYQWLIDSIFESGSRHHLSDVAFLAILGALAMTAERFTSKESV